MFVYHLSFAREREKLAKQLAEGSIQVDATYHCKRPLSGLVDPPARVQDCRDHEQFEDPDLCGASYYKLNTACRALYQAALSSAKRNYTSWDSMYYSRRDPLRTVKHSFTAETAARLYQMEVLMHAPHLYYQDQGVPAEPPCKFHGWGCSSVKFERWNRKPRRAIGTVKDILYGTTEHLCRKQHKEYCNLKDELKDMVRSSESASVIAAQKQLIKDTASGYFQATDPMVLAHYAAHNEYKWVAALFDIKEYKRYSTTRELEWLVEGAVRIGNASSGAIAC